VDSIPKAKMHGMIVIDGMAHRETSELGREGLEVGTKERITQIRTPIIRVAWIVI